MRTGRTLQAEPPLPSRDDLSRIFEAAPNPYLLLRADAPVYTIAAVNNAYLEAVGAERAAILGRGLFDVFPDNPHDGSATGVSDLRSSLDHVLRDGAADVMGIQKYDIPLRDGSGHFEVKYWSPVNTPVRRQNGEIDFIIHRVEDVTEFIVARDRSSDEFARKIQSVTAKADRMEAEVLRAGTQIKEANRELKQALERVAEANAKLANAGQDKSRQLDVAIEAAHLGLWTLDFETRELVASDRCRIDHGWMSSARFTRDAMASLIHPDDRERARRMMQQALAMRQDLEVEYRIIRPDGEIAWMLVSGRAEYDADGKPVRAVGVSLDITQRKRAEERQNAMIAELNHRVKNTLASVQSIALQTSMAAPEPKDFLPAFDGRVRALVMAHDLLTANAWQGASLKDIVARTLAPYTGRPGGGHRVDIAGPRMQLDPEAAVMLHMAVHELATNAVKYGALSAPEGSISVTWRLERDASPPALLIIWREQGGPAIAAPTRRGFGSNLLQNGLARELSGSVTMNFEPAGLVCEMRFPTSMKISLA